LLGLSTVTIWGAVLTSQGPAFSVASIKLNSAGPPPKKPNGSVAPAASGSVREPPRGGRVSAQGITARTLIRYAYGEVGSNGQIVRPLEAERVIGGPRWVDELMFNLEAQMDDPSRGPGDRMQMMRTLLTERFTLQASRTSRTLAVYSLVWAQSDRRFGPALREVNEPCQPTLDDQTGRSTPCAVRSTPGRLTGHGVAMPAVATYLSPIVGRVVVDRTALGGRYDVALQFAPLVGSGTPTDNPQFDDGPSIFTALREQLGLRLESARAPVDVVVIDRIERPSED